MEKFEKIFIIGIVVILVIGLGWAVWGMVRTESSANDISVGSEQYERAVSAQDPGDPCATPPGYTDEDWREHMSHHPEQHQDCL